MSAAPTWLFDLDNTLHNASPYIFPHINRAMRDYIERHLGLDRDAANHLRQQPAVVQGQPVKVVSGGPGFQVANDGVALSSAANGQAAQVRLSSGQVVRGIARSGGVVEITLP